MHKSIAPSLLLLSTAATSTAIFMDDFNTGNFSIAATNVAPSQEAVRTGPTSSIIGGQRDAWIRSESGVTTASAIVSDGSLRFEKTGGVGTLQLQWDGFDGELETDGFQTPGASLNANLLAVGAFEFRFNFDYIENNGAPPAELTVTLKTQPNSAVTASAALPTGNNVTVVMAFSQFHLIDFANLNLFQIRFDTFSGPTPFRVGLNSITTHVVPEPVTAVVLGSGLLLALRRRVRRSRG